MRRRAMWSAKVVAALVAIVVVGLAGCGGGGAVRSEEAFCDELGSSRPAQAEWEEFRRATLVFDQQVMSETRFGQADADELRAALGRVADRTPEADADAWELWERLIVAELEPWEAADFQLERFDPSDFDRSAAEDFARLTPAAQEVFELAGRCGLRPTGEPEPDEDLGG